MEEESANWEAKEEEEEEEARGEKRKADDEGFQGQEEASGDGMAIEELRKHDASHDGRLAGQRDKDGRDRAHEEQVALGRSVKERRVGEQDRFGQVGRHQQWYQGELRHSLQTCGKGLPKRRQGQGGSICGSSTMHGS